MKESQKLLFHIKAAPQQSLCQRLLLEWELDLIPDRRTTMLTQLQRVVARTDSNARVSVGTLMGDMLDKWCFLPRSMSINCSVLVRVMFSFVLFWICC